MMDMTHVTSSHRRNATHLGYIIFVDSAISNLRKQPINCLAAANLIFCTVEKSALKKQNKQTNMVIWTKGRKQSVKFKNIHPFFLYGDKYYIWVKINISSRNMFLMIHTLLVFLKDFRNQSCFICMRCNSSVTT